MSDHNFSEFCVSYLEFSLLNCVDMNSRVVTLPLHGMLWAIVLGRNCHELG